ncbi:hypothetical protein V8G54_026021 [Vigna mungo]|uniref:Uncharacterized protein n=1 Tax=Vigna mungo TaxID=3915 RepID=A0AAQ3MZG2_VIGMU
MPDVETETNPIDRTVAHLLFHSPVELTQNYSDNLQSPVSTKVQCESKAANLVNFPMSCLPDEDSKNNQQLSHLGLKNSWNLKPLNEEERGLSRYLKNPGNQFHGCRIIIVSSVSKHDVLCISVSVSVSDHT